MSGARARMGDVRCIDGSDGYTLADSRSDCCFVHAAIADVVQLALDLDDAGLADCSIEQLEAASVALEQCQRFGCDNHYGQRVAMDALSHAQSVELQRLADLDEQEADAQGPGCCRGANCARCVGGPRWI